MKKSLLILLSTILFNMIGFGQHYKPFISESKQWKYVQTLGLLGSGMLYNVETEYFKGDTLFSGFNYNKYYIKQSQPTQLLHDWLTFFVKTQLAKKCLYMIFNLTKPLFFMISV